MKIKQKKKQKSIGQTPKKKKINPRFVDNTFNKINNTNNNSIFINNELGEIDNSKNKVDKSSINNNVDLGGKYLIYLFNKSIRNE